MQPSQALIFKRPLWKHQADALDRFYDKTEAALLHEMGVGKTTTAIAWLRAKYNMARDIQPTLIVSPVATLINWKEEFEKNAPERVSANVVVLHGKTKDRLTLLDEDSGKIFITNPESFDKLEVVKALYEKRFSLVVIDEAHRFKNHESKRLKNLLKVTDRAQCRMILTGTPILNSYLDIWAQWRILDLGVTFGSNFYTFRERYFRDENIAWKGKQKYFPKYVPRAGIDKELSALIDFKASRIKKSECLSLPPLVRKTEHVELSTEQFRTYRQMENELITEVASGTCVATTALTRVLRMLQILTGYVQVETAEWDGRHRIKDNPRLMRLKEILEEVSGAHKTIVWCTFQENYRMIQAVCDELGLEWAELTGQTKDRDSNIKRFQLDSRCRVMISNPQAGGIGVNLTAASYSVYYSRSFSLGDRLQSEARNHRGGSEQHERITLIDLVAPGTLDEDVLRALSNKEDFSANILDRLSKRY